MKARISKALHFSLGVSLVLNFVLLEASQIQGYAQLSPAKPIHLDMNHVGLSGDPSHGVVGVDIGQNHQALPSSLTPTMFHYQMIPQPQPQPQPHQYSVPSSRTGKRKRCIMTENGVKCKLRRDGQDSYLMASGSSGHSSSYGVPEMSGGWGWGWPAEEEDGGSDLLGLLGLIGLKGLKGLAGLKGLVTLLPFLPFLLPFLLPIILPIIALPLGIIGTKLTLLAIAFLFIPLPVGRSFLSVDNINILRNASFSNLPTVLGNVLNSEECVERISCQVARTGREYGALGWMEKLANSLSQEGRYLDKMKKGFQFHKVKSHKASNRVEGVEENEIGNDLNFDECKKFRCSSELIFTKSNNGTAENAVK